MQQPGDPFLDRPDVRRHLRLLRHDRTIHVPERIPFRFDDFPNFFEQDRRVSIFECRIRIRKMVSDISFADRSESRIRDCMQQYIRIRMADQTFCMRDCHAADDERPSFREFMYIKTLSDPYHSIVSPCRFFSKYPPYSKSSGVVILILS